MRRRPAVKKKIIPDAKYNEIVVARFINYLMKGGKKSVVEKAVYDALQRVEKKLSLKAIDAFKKAVDNVTPRIEVRSKRIGGATYQIPVEVQPRRGSSLALKWLKTAIRKTSGRSLSDKIFTNIVDSIDNKGWAAKKREEVFKMAESNKAFAHYA